MSAVASTALATTRRAVAARLSSSPTREVPSACSSAWPYLAGSTARREPSPSQPPRRNDSDDVPYQCEDLRHSTLEGTVDRLIEMRRLYEGSSGEDTSAFESVVRSTLGGSDGDGTVAIARSACRVCGSARDSCDFCSSGERVVAFIQEADQFSPSSLHYGS